ncbi:uncharacterized protein PV09_06105 [Verruconis gallopava]|uniref:Uncharacterized protein n=1 Tax=Verruconis gallopava TaxID=253628 RepID=A0A0D2A7E1_9PEZI|nr:uncharacterized protein PV09_06105 [Verruconis gallopava]KIW02668.1 hypothetical protein PV09_06105 [Verruconis gallopava]
MEPRSPSAVRVFRLVDLRGRSAMMGVGWLLRWGRFRCVFRALLRVALQQPRRDNGCYENDGDAADDDPTNRTAAKSVRCERLKRSSKLWTTPAQTDWTTVIAAVLTFCEDIPFAVEPCEPAFVDGDCVTTETQSSLRVAQYMSTFVSRLSESACCHRFRIGFAWLSSVVIVWVETVPEQNVLENVERQ